MEAPIVANECAARKIEITEAAEKEENVGSSSNCQKKNFELLDSTYFAAAHGDITKFQQHGQGVDQILTPNGNTILHIYITARPRRVGEQERKTDDFVRGILETCPDLLLQANFKGETLLHMAARHGHADIAKLLLDECNKSWQNHDQERGIKATRRMLQVASYKGKDTALHEAVRYNYLDVVEILTKEDPSLPYEANTAGETLLYLAAERQHARVLKAILDNCDSPADGGPCDRTALHMAVFHNDEEMTTLLLAKKRICNSKRDQQGWTPADGRPCDRTALHNAVFDNDEEMTTSLLAKRRIRNSKLDQQGWTLLHFAAHLGHIEILKKLLAEDKDAAYMGDKEGKTALHVAAAGGKVKIMQELLSTCPGCCELVDNRGWNVLHFAVTRHNNFGAIRLILQNRCFRNLVNEKDENGNTPFLQAAYTGHMRNFLNFPILIDPLELDQVDMQVFNHHNYNAADIISADKSRLTYLFPNLSLLLLEKYKVTAGMRTRVSENDNGKSKSQEEEVNPMSREIKDGANMRAVNHVNKIIDNNLLAATLIATVSFAAGIAVPGGFISDKGPEQGTAILTGNGAFRYFVLFNTYSFFLSTLAVFFHLFESHFSSNTGKHKMGMVIGQYLTTFAMVFMMGAFISGTRAVLRSHEGNVAMLISIAAALCIFPILVACFLFYEKLVVAGYNLQFRALTSNNKKLRKSPRPE